MHQRALGALLVAGLVPVSAWSQGHAPIGPEFRVNTATLGYQYLPAVAPTSVGGFVVVWQSPDADHNGVFARRYDATGTAEGAAEFRVNSFTTGFQGTPAVAPAAGGGFVVAWNSFGQDGFFGGVFAQRYDDALTPLGGEFRVNNTTTDSQTVTSVAADGSGGFRVAWFGVGPPGGSGYDVLLRRYDALGTPAGSEFRVNTYTTNAQRRPIVASNAAGDFVVAWMSHSQDGNYGGIFGQRFDAAGGPVGGEFAVNTYTPGDQVYPGVGVAPDGSFVIVWQSASAADISHGIWARRYKGDGVALGPPFAVNQYSTGAQRTPLVAFDDKGNFLVVWISEGQDGDGFGVFGRAFDAAGAPLGDELRINSYTTGNQSFPSLASGPDGTFVVVWSSLGQDGSGWGVFGQRLEPDFLFADGVEYGNLGAWSTSSTDGGDLSASALAAMKLSAFGLRALVDDTAGLYVQDDTPNDVDHYRARFYFDPNGFDPGEVQAHRRTRIFIAFEDGPRRLVAVVLRRLGGSYSLMARARLDDDSQADTPFVPISDAPHVVELDWRRSTKPEAQNGSLELWIDGVSAATLTGLDNSISAVDFVRMGALSVKTGANGSMYWDEFESRRVSYIGP